MFGVFLIGIIILYNNMHNISVGNRLQRYNNPELFGVFIAAATWVGLWMAIGFSLCLYLYYKKNNRKLIVLGLFFLTIVILSGTRKLILFLCIVICSIFYVRNPKKWLMKSILLIPVLFLLYLAVMNIQLFYDTFGWRLNLSIHIFWGQTNITADFSMFERAFMIESAREFWQERPLFGQGIHSFHLHLGMRTHPHNNFWDLLHSTGIIGFMIYYARYVYFMYATVGLYLRDREKNREALFFTGLIIALLSIQWWQHVFTSRSFTIIYLIVALYLHQAKRRDMHSAYIKAT